MDRQSGSDRYYIEQVAVTITDKEEFLAQLREISRKNTCTVVCLNKEIMAGRMHVETALSHAIRAWEEKRQISRSLEIEILLYAAGTRQTSLIGEFGPHAGYNLCYLCMVPPKQDAINELLGFMPICTDDWEAISEKKREDLMKFFFITNEEIDAVGEERLKDLVCERTALLTVNR